MLSPTSFATVFRQLAWTCAITSTFALTGEAFGSHKFKVGGHTPVPFKAPSPNAPAAHVLTLTRKSGGSKSASYLKSLRKGSQVNGTLLSESSSPIYVAF